MLSPSYDWAHGWAPLPIPTPLPTSSSDTLASSLAILRIKLENLDTLLHRIEYERDSNPAAKAWMDSDWLLMELEDKPCAYLAKVGDVYREHQDWIWEVEAEMAEDARPGNGSGKGVWGLKSKAKEAEREVDAYADVLRDILAGAKHASVEAALEKLRDEIDSLARQQNDVEQSPSRAKRVSDKEQAQQRASHTPIELDKGSPAVLSSVTEEKMNAKIGRDLILSRLMGIGRKVQPMRHQQTHMTEPASPPSKVRPVAGGDASPRLTRSASSVTRRSSLRHVKTLSVEEMVVVTPKSPVGPIRRSSRHRRKSSRFEPYA